MKIKSFFLFVLAFCALYKHAEAQHHKPRLFMNCAKDCYQDYIKTSLSYFDFVRDRFDADIQVLVIEQEQSDGGRMFTLEFLGQGEWAHVHDTTHFSLHQSATPSDVREHIVQHMSVVLIKRLPNSMLAEDIEITFPTREMEVIDTLKDHWDFWIISPGISGWGNGSNNNIWCSLDSDLTIRRVKSGSKFIIKNYLSPFISFYNIDGQVLKGSCVALGTNVLYAKSINEHWSLGGLAQVGSDTYQNIRRSFKFAPVGEFNIFPFSMNTSKQLRIAYQAGLTSFAYGDTTIYEKTKELRPYHRLTFTMEYNRPWGSVMASLFGNTYLDNFSQNRLGLRTVLSLRIFEGVLLELVGESYYVNDQISLLKTPLSDEIYLLGIHQLPAFFNYEFEFGFRITMGSKFANVVNPRFGSVE